MAGPGDELDIGVQAGDVLAGKYRVERVLGAGGMGVVVAAHHVQLDTKVAIKFLLATMLENEEAVVRFAREARAAVKITSENVARVLDVGTLETGAPYIVMEFLEGGDLAAWLEQRGPLPIDQAVEFVLQACVAVAEAHGLGIVHRDLKPANLFCIRRPDGQLSIKVLDFGISKLMEAGHGVEGPSMSVTKTSAVLGSPVYMSPEQMQASRSADAQSDIWALGVILYELIAGRVPFDGEAATAVAVNVATQAPPLLHGFRPDVPPGLEAVILKCLEKERRNRYANVAELALALAEFAPARARGSIERITGTVESARLAAGALATPPRSPASGPVVHGTIAPVGQTSPGIPGVTPRRRLVLGLALAGLLVVVGALVLFVRTLPASQASRSAPSALESGAQVPAALPSPAWASTSLSPPVDSAPAVAVVQPPQPIPPQVPPTTPPNSRPPPFHASPAPAPAGHVPTPTSTSGSCDPPFTLDDQGRKHFKPECYLKR